MYLDELLEYLSKPNGQRKKTYTLEDLRRMSSMDGSRLDAQELAYVFTYEKAQHEPSPTTVKMRESLRAHGADEDFITEMTARYQRTEFRFEFDVASALRDAFYYYDRGYRKDSGVPCTIESFYNVESFC